MRIKDLAYRLIPVIYSEQDIKKQGGKTTLFQSVGRALHSSNNFIEDLITLHKKMHPLFGDIR